MALAGYDLKLDYGDAADEARRCRSDCALFDFSFLEGARLEGERAQGVIERFTGRPLQALGIGEIFYALRLNERGLVSADWTIWRTGDRSFEVMSGRREDVLDLLACAGPGIAVADVTADRVAFALQGPRTLDVLRKLGDAAAIEALRYFTFTRATLAGIPCTVGRLGYTGELGVEIIAEREKGAALWRALSAHAAPAGFIAADMLRIEAGFVLFTHEFGLPVSAHEAGLGKFGRPTESLTPEIELVSFRAEADVPVSPWRPAQAPRRPVAPGTIAVTSACTSNAAGGILGLGYVLAGADAATPLRDATGTFRNIRLTPMPFYDTAKRRPRADWR